MEPRSELSIQQRSLYLRVGGGDRNNAPYGNVRFGRDASLRSARLGRERGVLENRLVERQRPAAQLSETFQERICVSDLLRLFTGVSSGRKSLPGQRALSGGRLCSRRTSHRARYRHDSQSELRSESL